MTFLHKGRSGYKTFFRNQRKSIYCQVLLTGTKNLGIWKPSRLKNARRQQPKGKTVQIIANLNPALDPLF